MPAGVAQAGGSRATVAGVRAQRGRAGRGALRGLHEAPPAEGCGAWGALPCLPQVPGRYTITRLDEKGVSDALALRSGDEVELVQEGDEGLW